MKIVYDPVFINKLKKLDVRTRNSFKEKIALFQNNPFDPILDNHALQREFMGYRSIDITANYRAVFEELEGTIYFFFLISPWIFQWVMERFFSKRFFGRPMRTEISNHLI